jgi:hypothetical protein
VGKEWIPRAEGARRLGVSRSTIQRWVKSGRVRGQTRRVAVGGHYERRAFVLLDSVNELTAKANQARQRDLRGEPESHAPDHLQRLMMIVSQQQEMMLSQQQRLDRLHDECLQRRQTEQLTTQAFEGVIGHLHRLLCDRDAALKYYRVRPEPTSKSLLD